MDGACTSARFDEPYDVAFTSGDLLVADLSNRKLRLIAGVTNGVCQVSTVHDFPSGPGTEPRGLALTPDGSSVLVACTNAIYKVTDFRSAPSTALLAGGAYGIADGNGGAAQFQVPCGLKLTPDGNNVLIAGHGSHRLRDLR